MTTSPPFYISTFELRSYPRHINGLSEETRGKLRGKFVVLLLMEEKDSLKELAERITRKYDALIAIKWERNPITQILLAFEQLKESQVKEIDLIAYGDKSKYYLEATKCLPHQSVNNAFLYTAERLNSHPGIEAAKKPCIWTFKKYPQMPQIEFIERINLQVDLPPKQEKKKESILMLCTAAAACIVVACKLL